MYGSVWARVQGVCRHQHVYICMQYVCVAKSLKFPPSENLMSWVKQPSPGMLLGHDPASVRPPTPS